MHVVVGKPISVKQNQNPTGIVGEINIGAPKMRNNFSANKVFIFTITILN